MDKKLCFSKEVPAFDAKDISVPVVQALERLELLIGDSSRADNVLSAMLAKSRAQQMIERSQVSSMNCPNFSEGSERFVDKVNFNFPSRGFCSHFRQPFGYPRRINEWSYYSFSWKTRPI